MTISRVRGITGALVAVLYGGGSYLFCAIGFEDQTVAIAAGLGFAVLGAAIYYWLATVLAMQTRPDGDE